MASGARAAASALRARPRPDVAPRGRAAVDAAGGWHRLAHGRALLHLPGGLDAPLPLVVLLHGAGSSAASVAQVVDLEAHDVALLVPSSLGFTWDAVRGAFGADVVLLDGTLGQVFGMLAIDPARIVLAGFSDGASYALSLGIANGDLFTHLVAFSPGFVAPGPVEGRPRIFVSHGVDDPVLPVDRCSRRLVPRLRSAGYDVTYREFDGGHAVPPPVALEAMAWLGA